MTELVVVVVVLRNIAVVVERGDVEAADGVHSGRGVTGGFDFNGVLVELLDAADVGHAAGHFGVGGGLGGDEASLYGAEHVGAINVTAIFGSPVSFRIAAVEGNGFVVHIFNGRHGGGNVPSGASAVTGEGAIFVDRSEVPHRHGERNVHILGHVRSGFARKYGASIVIVEIISDDIVGDRLYVGGPLGLKVIPKSSLLFLGPSVGGSPSMIGASSVDGVKNVGILGVDSIGGLRLVVLQTDDLVRGEGGRSNVGGIRIHIIGEDDVIGISGLTVAEHDVIAHLDGVGSDVGVFVIHNAYITRAGVGVIGSVVRNGFTLDRVVDDTAHTVGGQHGNLRHGDRILIVAGIGIERAELLAEGVVRNNQRRGVYGRLSGSDRGGRRFGGGDFRGCGSTAGSEAQAHHANQRKCKVSLEFFLHCVFLLIRLDGAHSPPVFINISKLICNVNESKQFMNQA